MSAAATRVSTAPSGESLDKVAKDRRAGRAEWSTYAAAAGLTAVLAAVALRLWHAAIGVPFYYVGDAVAVGAHVKTVLETGWYENQPSLGAPAGQVYHDFPTAENLHLGVMALMNPVVDQFGVAMNVYYLLGFPLAAVTAVWFLRLAGVSRAMSVVLAVLFALAPYHFERNIGHLWLASYYPVPLALGVVLVALRGDRLWGAGRSSRRPVAVLTGPGALTVVAMVLVAAGSSYYAVFTALLLGVAGLVAFWRDRDWRRFAGAVAAGGVLVLTLVANALPDILYAQGRVPNTLAMTRYASEAEVYGLKLAQLLLPSDQHRWEPLRDLGRRYNENFPLPGEEPEPALGLVAGSGLLLLAVVLVAVVVRGPLAARADSARRRTLRHLSLLVLVALTSAVIGGLSTFVALFVTDSIRGWNRMSIVIAVLSLAAVGLVIDAGVSRLRAKRWPRRARPAWVSGVAALGVLSVGVLDQTSDAYIPDYAGNAAVFASDDAYVEAVDEALPPGAAVYQLPHIVFPETAPVHGVLDTDPLRLYLHSDDLRWSAGGLKGRPRSDWPTGLADRPVSTVVAAVAVAGFSGISVDRNATADAGAQLAGELAAELGAAAAQSPDGRYAFWTLDGVVEDLLATYGPQELEQVREAVLLPPVAYLKPDFFEPRPLPDGTTTWPSRVADPRIFLDNARDVPVDVELSLGISSATGAGGAILEVPGSPPRTLDLTGGRVEINQRLSLPPGRTTVTLALTPAARTASPDPEWERFDVSEIELVDPVLEGFTP